MNLISKTCTILISNQWTGVTQAETQGTQHENSLQQVDNKNFTFIPSIQIEQCNYKRNNLKSNL